MTYAWKSQTEKDLTLEMHQISRQIQVEYSKKIQKAQMAMDLNELQSIAVEMKQRIEAMLESYRLAAGGLAEKQPVTPIQVPLEDPSNSGDQKGKPISSVSFLEGGWKGKSGAPQQIDQKGTPDDEGDDVSILMRRSVNQPPAGVILPLPPRGIPPAIIPNWQSDFSDQSLSSTMPINQPLTNPGSQHTSANSDKVPAQDGSPLSLGIGLPPAGILARPKPSNIAQVEQNVNGDPLTEADWTYGDQSSTSGSQPLSAVASDVASYAASAVEDRWSDLSGTGLRSSVGNEPTIHFDQDEDEAVASDPLGVGANTVFHQGKRSHFDQDDEYSNTYLLPMNDLLTKDFSSESAAAAVVAKRTEAERLEAERLEAERLEAARLEAARLEAARLEAARLEAARLEAARLEAARLEAARLEAERLEAERLEAERLEAERLEAERLEAERLEAERLEAERLEAERLEAERLEAERLEGERLKAERLEAERLEAERLEAERLEAERLEGEGLESHRQLSLFHGVNLPADGESRREKYKDFYNRGYSNLNLDLIVYDGDRDVIQGLLDEPEFAEVWHAIHSSNEAVSARRDLLKSALRLTKAMAPVMFRIVEKCKNYIGLKGDLEIYVHQDSQFNATVFPPHNDRIYILLTSALLENFTESELEFVIGHEIGHFLFNHFDFPVCHILREGGGELTPLQAMKLYSWKRNAEVSADRIGLMICRDFNAVARAFFKLSSGISNDSLTFQLNEYIDQFQDLQAESTSDVVGPEDWYSTHPFSPLRIKALQLYESSVSFYTAIGQEGGSITEEEMERKIKEFMSIMEPSYLSDEQEGAAEIQKFIFLAGFAIAAANGKIDDAEIKSLAALIPEAVYSACMLELSDITNPETEFDMDAIMTEVARAADNVNIRIPLVGKLNMIKDLSIIVYSDGVVEEAEVSVLYGICHFLGIHPEFADRVLHDAGQGLD